MYTLIVLIVSFLGPIIGSLFGVLFKPTKKFIHDMLAFSAGVMLAISFVEMIPQSIEHSSIIITSLGILIGAIIMFIFDNIIPHIHPKLSDHSQGMTMKKTALYLIFGIFLHNFPEGLAISTGIASDSGTLLSIAFAIAIHNIPEGICTSAPYYASTKKKLHSFLISSLTAIPILVGFLSGRYIFNNISQNIFGLIISITAGLMIFISTNELIPFSCNKDDSSTKVFSHSSIFFLIFGIIFVILLGAI